MARSYAEFIGKVVWKRKRAQVAGYSNNVAETSSEKVVGDEQFANVLNIDVCLRNFRKDDP